MTLHLEVLYHELSDALSTRERIASMYICRGGKLWVYVDHVDHARAISAFQSYFGSFPIFESVIIPYGKSVYGLYLSISYVCASSFGKHQREGILKNSTTFI